MPVPAARTWTEAAWPARTERECVVEGRWLDRLDEEGRDRVAAPVVDAEGR